MFWERNRERERNRKIVERKGDWKIKAALKRKGIREKEVEREREIINELI